jgi:hypothetical protein
MRIIGVLLVAAPLVAAAACGSTGGNVLQAVDAGGDSPLTEPDATGTDAPSDAQAAEASDAGCDGSFDSDPANCGACGHDCLGGACVTGQCQPVLLATGGMPFSVTVDDTRVYWVNDMNAGDVRSVAKDGSAPLTIASNVAAPYSVFVDASRVYWTEMITGRVWSADKMGSNAVLLSDTQLEGPWAVVADAISAYWLDIYNFRGVAKAPFTGLPDGGMPAVLASGWAYVFGITQDSTNIYFTSEGDEFRGDAGQGIPGKVLSVPKDGSSAAKILADNLAWPRFVAVDAAAVYWTDSTSNAVFRLPFGDSQPTQIAQGQQPYGVAVDDTNVYFTTLGTDQADGTLVRVPKSGSSPSVVLATGLSYPSQVAVDAAAIYWGNTHGGTVMKIAK